MTILDKITSLFKKSKPVAEALPVQSDRYSPVATQAESESTFEYDIFKVENDRRSILNDVQRLLKDDPRVAEGNRRMATDATRGGLAVVVNGSAGDVAARNIKRRPGATTKARANALATRAQEVIDDLIKTTRINAKLPSWGRRLIADGDLFLNVIVDMRESRIIDLRRVPPGTMKRNIDEQGQFVDITKSFSQLDPLVHTASYFPGIPESALGHYALWQINHLRWNYTDGEPYGESQYMQIRRLSRQLQMTEEDLVVRRRTRAVQRRFHQVGTKEKPQDWSQVEEYKKKNSLEKNSFKQTTDYFGNGLTDVKNLDGDANLHEIEDIIYLLNMEFLRIGVPKGLLGFAEDINRDVLDEQQKQYEKSLELLTDTIEYGDPGPFSGLRDIVDLALLLQGINPESITYNIRWSEKSNEPSKDRTERILSVRREKLLSRRTALMLLANDFDIEDVDDELTAIAEEEPANPTPPPGPQLPPGELVKDCSCGGHIVDTQEWEDGFQEAEMDTLEAEVLKVTQEFFARVHKRLIIGLEETGINDNGQAITDEDSTDNKIDNIVEAFLKAWIIESALYLIDLTPLYKKAVNSGGSYAYAQVGIEFNLKTEAIFNRLNLDIGERIKGIEQTTLDQIREALTEGYLQGEGSEKIAKRIDQVFGTAQSVRAEVIAQTEMMWAYNKSTLHVYRQADMKKVKWYAARDKRTCTICAGLDGNVYLIDEVPPCPYHPRCRCTLLPVMD